nr:hypothetical protein [Bdellovibrionales bacterium]
MRELGFENPAAMIDKFPAVLNFSIDTMAAKLTSLTALGFSDALDLASRFPSVLSFNINETVRSKIEGMRALGIVDPVRMLETYPVFIGLSFENNFKPTFLSLRNDWLFTTEQIEVNPSIMSSSLSRMNEIAELLFEQMGIKPDSLSLYVRQSLIRSISAADILGQLSDRGFTDLETQKAALSDAKNFSWIFKKYKGDCEKLLAN